MNKQQVSFSELQQRPYLKVPDCSTVTGLSQGFIRGLIRDGVLPVVKNGRCVFVNKKILLDIVESMLRQQTDHAVND